jgi:hypothetical protein
MATHTLDTAVMQITIKPIAMPSGITVVAWSSRMRSEATTAPTAVPSATTPTRADASVVS